MKKTLLFAVLAMGISSAYAQLSTRENDDTVEKLGARPAAGDMALTFGFDYRRLGNKWAQFHDDYLDLSVANGNSEPAALYSSNFLNATDILTFRYYMDDDLAFRAGIRLAKISSKSSGTAAAETDEINPAPGFISFENKTSRREYILVPGIEKHFSSSNIFDVYAGGDLYLGLRRDRFLDELITNDENSYTLDVRTNTNVVGLGGVVGFNVFVAHLPISLGLEYGWNLKWTFGPRAKVSDERTINGDTYSLEYLISDHYSTPGYANLAGVEKYDEYRRRSFAMDTNQNVRLLINIYFGQ